MKSQVNVQIKKRDGVPLVEVAGEIDISNIGEFKQAIQQAEELGGAGVFIDLCGVTFIDTAGLAELIVAAKRLRTRDETLHVVVKETSQPEYVLRITGLDAILDVCYPQQD